jgi:hypothetical protein
MKALHLLALCLLSACFSRTSMMTNNEFADITLGTPIEEVTKKVGQPYAIYSLGNGVEEYEYIERISIEGNLLLDYHYYLTVQNHQVTGKRYSRERPNPAMKVIEEEDPNNLGEY